jgi:hypothetical protein
VGGRRVYCKDGEEGSPGRRSVIISELSGV